MSDATRAEAAEAWRALVKRVREVYGDEDAEPWTDSFAGEIARVDRAIRADEHSATEVALAAADALVVRVIETGGAHARHPSCREALWFGTPCDCGGEALLDSYRAARAATKEPQ